jgi:predicted RNA-binding protein
MCLSTAYKEVSGQQDMVCQYVSNIEIQDGRVVLTDVMGQELAVDGTLKKVDLVNNVVVIQAAD